MTLTLGDTAPDFGAETTDGRIQLTDRHKVSTPVNGRRREDVIIAGSGSDEQAMELFGERTAPQQHSRIGSQPREREEVAP
jgi:hypothetical protein